MSCDLYSVFFGELCDDDYFKHSEIKLIDKYFENDDERFIKLLERLKSRAEKKETYFHLSTQYAFAKAVKKMKYEIVYRFLQRASYVYFENAAVYEAAKNNNLTLVKRLVRDGMRDNLALKAAYENNNIEMFDFLFHNGMRFRIDGERFKCINE